MYLDVFVCNCVVVLVAVTAIAAAAATVVASAVASAVAAAIAVATVAVAAASVVAADVAVYNSNNNCNNRDDITQTQNTISITSIQFITIYTSTIPYSTILNHTNSTVGPLLIQ